MRITLAELAEKIGASLSGDGARTVTGCNTLADATDQQVSFLTNPRYADQAGHSAAAAIICSPQDAQTIPGRNLLVARHTYFAFRQAMVLLHGFPPRPDPGIDPSARVDPAATVGEGCHIGPFVSVGPGTVIGARTVLASHIAVGRDVRIGDDCLIDPNVTIYDRSVLGDRVTVHAGCSIGHDGYGYAIHQTPDDAQPIHHKIPQTGIAVIEDDVELGANCSIDRATIGATVIGAGSKFSDNVVIGHGSSVGKHNLLVAQVGLAGSVTTGDYAALGGQVGVAGHLKLGDRVRIAATSGVMNDVPDGESWGGAPAIPIKQAFRNHTLVQKLPELHKRIKHLERQIAALELESQT